MAQAPLSPAQVDQYHVFGFLVLRSWFSAEETAALRRELEEALHREYPRSAWAENRRLFCSMFDERLPTFAPLLGDPRVLGVAEQLHGRCLPVYSEGNRYQIGDTGWHADLHQGMPDPFDSAGIKFIHYLEPLTASSGALRVIPGSHRRPLHDEVRRHLAEHGMETAHPASVACETRPGDVVVFNSATYHAAANVRSHRFMHDLALYPWPTPTVGAFLREALSAQVPPTRESMGWRGEWFTREWIARGAVDPERRALVERIHEGGVFAAVGADLSAVSEALGAGAVSARA